MTGPSPSFRSSTVVQPVQQPDGRWELIVVQVNIVPVTSEDEANMELASRMALGTVNGYGITISNREIVDTLRYIADQVEGH